MDQALQDQISALVQGQLSQGVAQVAQMQAQLAAALANQSTATPPAATANLAPYGPEEEEVWTSESAWEDILPQVRRLPQSGAGEALVARLQFPPPLDKVRQLQKDVQGVLGIPETVPARKHFKDRQLQQLQLKQEQVLTMLTMAVEASDIYEGPLITAAALARSSWEDLQDLRRREFAGRDAHKLDKREDASNLRLLSPAEEKLMTAQRGKGKGKGKGKGFRNVQPQFSGYTSGFSQQQPSYYSQSSNWRDNPSPKPWKGGKGKGRSRSAQPARSAMQE
jgi:hypothetical protein